MADDQEQGKVQPQVAAPAQSGKPAAPKMTQKISGLELVRFRNFFYRDGYRKVMTALLMSIALNLALVTLVIIQIFTKPAPVYFATQSNGSLIEIQPLTEPMVDQDMLITWATRAAVAAYSFNFVDWQNDLQSVQQYFTETGFKNFTEALKQSGNLDTVVAKRLVVQATVVDVPRIVNQGLIKGRYAWKIQIPMLIKYTSASEELRQPVLVTMLIARVPTTQKPQGIAIAQFVVEDRVER